MPVAEMLAREPKAIILSGGPASVHVEGAPVDRRRDLRRRRADARHLLRRAARSRAISAARSRKTGTGEYGRTELHVERLVAAVRATCRSTQIVWMSHGDSITARARRVRGHRAHRRGAGRRRSRIATAASTACSSTPRSRTPSAGRRSSRRSSTTRAGCRPTWTNVSIIEHAVDGDPRPGRHASG